MKATSPTGVAIWGTKELVPGVAVTSENTFSRKPDGRLDFDYAGETELDWDNQRTVEKNGHTVFVDADGDEWNEDQIVLVDGEDDGDE